MFRLCGPLVKTLVMFLTIKMKHFLPLMIPYKLKHKHNNHGVERKKV